MFRRYISHNLLESIKDTPVTLVVGARQTGKTTLVKELADGPHPARYLTLDDSTLLAAAVGDPAGFIAGIPGPMVIDEVQHAPALFPAIKRLVDRDRSPGRFLLTGSANTLLLPKISESLAGRMEILTLWPLSQAEIESAGHGLIDLLFAHSLELPTILPSQQEDLIKRVLAGGYPEPLSRTTENRRRAWFRSYLTSILQRDVRDLAHIEGLTDMPRLLGVLASRMASLLNTADVSRSTGIAYSTLTRYMSLLQAVFLIQALPAWSTNIGLRLVHSPKLLFNDTGLASSFIGLDQERFKVDGNLFGHVLENFVILEIIKAIEVSDVRPLAYHYRTNAGTEVDVVLEATDGRLVAIEIKASSSVSSKDFRGIRAFSDSTKERFVRGFIFYTGDEIVPFSDNMFAVPISVLWSLPG